MLLPLHKHIQYDLDVSFFLKKVAQTVQNYSPVFNSMAGDCDYENFKVICFLSPLFVYLYFFISWIQHVKVEGRGTQREVFKSPCWGLNFNRVLSDTKIARILIK